jgi:hypothetical protein
VASQIDPSKPVDGVPAVKSDLRSNLLVAKTEIEALQDALQTETDALESGKADTDHVHTLADTEVSVSRDLQVSDAQNQLLRVDSTDPVTLTVPPVSSAAFPQGTLLTIARWGTGDLTIVAGDGVTLNKPVDRTFSARARYSVLGLWQKAPDDWLLFGDLA